MLRDVTAHGGLGASAKRIGLSGVEPMFVRERAGKDEPAWDDLYGVCCSSREEDTLLFRGRKGESDWWTC